MAIIKTGDDQPIVNYYDSDGGAMMCPTCNKKLVVVAINDSNNLVCSHCDLDEESVDAN